MHRSVTFLLVDIGCILIFLAFFNLNAALLPRFILYLGRISYGLYVFHLLILESILQLLLRNHQNVLRWPMVLLIQVSGLLLTVAVASLSYRFLEQPFLRLKKRFTFVQSGAPSSA